MAPVCSVVGGLDSEVPRSPSPTPPRHRRIPLPSASALPNAFPVYAPVFCCHPYTASCARPCSSVVLSHCPCTPLLLLCLPEFTPYVGPYVLLSSLSLPLSAPLLHPALHKGLPVHAPVLPKSLPVRAPALHCPLIRSLYAPLPSAALPKRPPVRAPAFRCPP